MLMISTCMTPVLVHVFDIEVRFDIDLPNPSLGGDRVFYRAASGTIRGSGIEGRVEPQAGDWAIRRPDGVLVNDQRIVFTLAGDRHLYMRSLGFTAPDGTFHSTPRFDVAAGVHDWITRTIFAGTGRLDAEGFSLQVCRLEGPA